MSDEIRDENADELIAKVSLDTAADLAPDAKGKFVLLPGLVAIALYMLVLAMVVAFRVVGKESSPLMLAVAALFVAASFGLLRMFRWAWALTLAAVFLLMSYNFWLFYSEKQTPGLVQGLLNMVFFFYLVRVDVRSRLR